MLPIQAVVKDAIVLLYDAKDELLSIEKISKVGQAQAKIGKFFRFNLRTGIEIGGTKKVRYPGFDELLMAEKLLAQQKADRELQEEEQRQRKYDALPKEVKLARKVVAFFDCASQDEVSRMPLGLLERIEAYINGVKNPNA